MENAQIYPEDNSSDSDEEDILTKSEVKQKMFEGDPDISLVFPSKTTSPVWNCYRIVVYKGIRLNFVTCLQCNVILVYKSQTGTASLLRHSCFRNTNQSDDDEGLEIYNNNTSDPKDFDDSSSYHISTTSNRPEKCSKIEIDEGNDVKSPPIQYPNESASETDPEEDDVCIIENVPVVPVIYNVNDESCDDLDVDENIVVKTETEMIQPILSNIDLAISLAGNHRALDKVFIYDNQLSKTELECKIKFLDKDIIIIGQDHRKSSIWARCDEIYYKKVKQFYVQCKLCKCLLTYKQSTGSASLLRHMCHLKKRSLEVTTQKEADGVDDDDENIPPKRLRLSTDDESIPICLQKLSAALPVVASRGNYVPKSRLNELGLQQIYFLCRELGFYDIFTNKSLKSMFQIVLNIGADYGHQSIDNILAGDAFIRTMLQEMHTEIVMKIQDSIADSTMAISFDRWTNQNKEFLTVVGYIVNESFQLKRFNLGTVEMKSIDNKEYVMRKVHSILEKYTNDIEKLLERCVLVCQHEHDFVSKAFENNKKVFCACYKITLIMQSILDFKCKELTNICSDILIVISFLREKLDRNKLNVMSTLYQLYNFDFSQLITNKSSKLELFQLMVDSHSDLVPIFDKNNSPEVLDSVDFNAISFVLQLLRPFENCIDRLSNDSIPTLNEVFLWKKKLEKLCQYDDDDDTFKKLFKSELSQLIGKHFVISDHHKAALFLDPNFKNLKFLTSSEHEAVIESVIKLIDVVPSDVTAVSDESDSKTNTTINDIFSEFMDFPSVGNKDDLAKQEIRTYTNVRLSEPMGSLDFWKCDKSNIEHLQKLSRKILNIPACSFHNVLKYTESGKQFAIKRKLLKVEDVDTTLFLYQNV